MNLKPIFILSLLLAVPLLLLGQSAQPTIPGRPSRSSVAPSGVPGTKRAGVTRPVSSGPPGLPTLPAATSPAIPTIPGTPATVANSAVGANPMVTGVSTNGQDANINYNFPAMPPLPAAAAAAISPPSPASSSGALSLSDGSAERLRFFGRVFVR